MGQIRFPDPPLLDAVVCLRPWAVSDAPAMALAFDDPVMRRFSWRDGAVSEDDAREYFAELERARLRGETLGFAIADPGRPGVLLGGLTLHEVRPEQGCAAVGYWLSPEARGRGAATAAVRLLAGWVFGAAGLGLARLELTCGPDNTASQRVAERSGFTREGLLRSHQPFRGGRRDSLIYSLLPGEV